MTLKLHLTTHWIEESYGKGFRIRPGILKNTKKHCKVVWFFCFVLYHFSYLDIHLTHSYFHSFCLWFVFYITVFVGCEFSFWLLFPTDDCLFGGSIMTLLHVGFFLCCTSLFNDDLKNVSWLIKINKHLMLTRNEKVI